MTDETKLADLLNTYLKNEFRGVYPSLNFNERSVKEFERKSNSRSCLIFKTKTYWGMRFSAIYMEDNHPIEYFDPWGKEPHADVVDFFYQNNLEWIDVNHRYLLPRQSPHSAAFCAYYLINRSAVPNPAILLAEFDDNLKKNLANLLRFIPIFL